MSTPTKTFQQAMTRLDQITKELSKPDLDLEQAMALFEEGFLLSKQCEEQLKEFEAKIDQLTLSKEPNDEDQ